MGRGRSELGRLGRTRDGECRRCRRGGRRACVRGERRQRLERRGPNAANVDLPASAPSVIGCGGTSKTRSTETVWNNNPGQSNGEGTGGGYSTLFPGETWQTGAPTPPSPSLGRMVPDVAANADPDTGYEIYFHGSTQVIGGTSAVAPFYGACSRRSARSSALQRLALRCGRTRARSPTS